MRADTCIGVLDAGDGLLLCRSEDIFESLSGAGEELPQGSDRLLSLVTDCVLEQCLCLSDDIVKIVQKPIGASDDLCSGF